MIETRAFAVGALALLMATAAPMNAQIRPAAVDFRVVAMKSVLTTHPGSAVVVVNYKDADASVGQELAARLGGRLISTAENATCGDHAPKCGWQLGDKTVAARVRVISETPSTITTWVEVWGTYRDKSATPTAFLEVWRVELERRGATWVVTKQVQITET